MRMVLVQDMYVTIERPLPHIYLHEIVRISRYTVYVRSAISSEFEHAGYYACAFELN